MILLAEIVDFQRFPHPRELMAYLGLVPSEYSSGDTQRRGAITKTGNTHARRVLVEAAWHYRHRPTVGGALRRRTTDQPPHIVSHAWRAQQRLQGVTAISRARQAAAHCSRGGRAGTGRLSLGGDDAAGGRRVDTGSADRIL